MFVVLRLFYVKTTCLWANADNLVADFIFVCHVAYGNGSGFGLEHRNQVHGPAGNRASSDVPRDGFA